MPAGRRNAVPLEHQFDDLAIAEDRKKSATNPLFDRGAARGKQVQHAGDELKQQRIQHYVAWRCNLDEGRRALCSVLVLPGDCRWVENDV